MKLKELNEIRRLYKKLQVEQTETELKLDIINKKINVIKEAIIKEYTMNYKTQMEKD